MLSGFSRRGRCGTRRGVRVTNDATERLVGDQRRPLGDDVVERVALDRGAAGVLDEADDLGRVHHLRRGGARHVIDALFLDGAVEIVGAEPERGLGGLDPQHDPVGLEVRDVVEQEPRHRVGAQVLDAGRPRQLHEGVVVGVKRQRNEGLKAARLVLQRAQAQHVVDPLLGRLDVAVEHGAVRAQPHLVGHPVNLQPLVGVALVVADLLPHAGREDLGAAAGERIEPRRPQRLQHPFDRHPELLGEVEDLHRGEGLEVDARLDSLQAGEKVGVIVE